MSPYYALDRQFFINELSVGVITETVFVDMSNSLYSKNKIGFVDGRIPMPEIIALPELAYWMLCNTMVKDDSRVAWTKRLEAICQACSQECIEL